MSFRLNLIPVPAEVEEQTEEVKAQRREEIELAITKNLIISSTEKYINELPVDLQQKEFDRISQEMQNINTLRIDERLESYEEACARHAVPCMVPYIIENGVVRQKVPR